MASQYGEEKLIFEVFGADFKGRFLDVGAFDGVTFSNTRPLYEAGWKGVLVEPAPPAFCRLMKLYADDPEMVLVNAAITPSGLPRWLHINSSDGVECDAMSTLVWAHRMKFGGHPFRRAIVPTMTWMQFIEAMTSNDDVENFDFINIDVEGLNMPLLTSLPFSNLDPRMVCVEIDPEEALPEMKSFLSERCGLIHQERVGGNLLAWRDA